MTPKKKSKELVDKFNYEEKHYLMLDAKQCALIAVNEILNINSVDKDYDLSNYWEEVKQEIENI